MIWRRILRSAGPRDVIPTVQDLYRENPEQTAKYLSFSFLRVGTISCRSRVHAK